jgi:hypothetical protein
MDVTQDAHDPTSVLTFSARVFAVDRTTIAAHSIRLPGLQADFLDTAVQVAVQSFQFGSPAEDLAPAMRRVKNAAHRHARAHEKR